ncbi:helix-turn-helix domain-containing protein [Kitasatospora sp. NPDC088134]|uniref:helix-turn-helix domain-containing protein n=1 Tax=Kitasatospora sp. NPDC088134 TaxID=3364071 RepID=UPI00382BEFCD
MTEPAPPPAPAPAPIGEGVRRLYLDVLDAGGRIAARAVPAERRADLDELLRTGLLVRDGIGETYLAVDPRFVTETLGAEMNAEAARLLDRAERLPAAFDRLINAYDSVPRPMQPLGADVQVIGHQQIRARIARLCSDARDEVLTADPGQPAASAFEASLQQELPILARGCRIRTLHRPGVLGEPAAIHYADALTTAGGEVRLLDEPFQRALVFDRAVAVVSAAEDHSRAAVITDPATVAMIAAGFDRDWARAERVSWRTMLDHAPSRAAADRVGRLLAQGLTQRAVADRLGLSERTVAGHLSRLRERHGADTLFQLGWLMRGGEPRD